MSEDIRIGVPPAEQPWHIRTLDQLRKTTLILTALLIVAAVGVALQVVSIIGAKNMADEAHQQTRHISSQLDEIHRTINATNPE